MMKNLFFAAAFIAAFSANAQITVNGEDINETVDLMEVYAFKKPFSTKEVFFINYGQDNFKLHYYDAKRQAIYNADGEKFKKGEWMQLYKYLRDNGWEKIDEREENLGNNKGRVVTFEKVKA